MADQEVPRLAWPEITTFSVRLAAFAVALAVIGALFLPWWSWTAGMVVPVWRCPC